MKTVYSAQVESITECVDVPIDKNAFNSMQFIQFHQTKSSIDDVNFDSLSSETIMVEDQDVQAIDSGSFFLQTVVPITNVDLDYAVYMPVI